MEDNKVCQVPHHVTELFFLAYDWWFRFPRLDNQYDFILENKVWSIDIYLLEYLRIFKEN